MRLIRNASGKLELIEGFVEDVTTSKEIEERLVRSEKLAVLGQLAGGVGHELRNPLTCIKNAAYCLKSSLLNLNQQQQNALNLIEKEVDKAVQVIEDLLNYAKNQKPEEGDVDIFRAIEDVLSQVSIPENVQVVRNKDDSISRIRADSAQIFQICDNIVRNAFEAMEDGGYLSIHVKEEENNRVSVSFTDTGSGICEKDIENIFHPLFTTKKNGIGLGLAITSVLVERNQGQIQVKSEMGKGSSFLLSFPAVKTSICNN